MIEGIPNTILEPTAGAGNLVDSIKNKFPECKIITPEDIYKYHPRRESIDWVLSNPPFTPMIKGFEILKRVRTGCKKIIILLPWLLLINSKERTNWFLRNGLCEIIHLPRAVFKGSRVQTCIMKFLPEDSDWVKLTFAERIKHKEITPLKEIFN